MWDLDLVSKFFAPVIQTIAIGVTAYFASRGLHAWREQLIGKRKLEVAEETLIATYKVRDALDHIRNPGSLGEGKTRKRDPSEPDNLGRLRDTYFVPLERIQATSDDFAQFQKARLLCEVYFGPEAGKPFGEVMKVRWKIVVSARMLIDTVGHERVDPKLHERWEADIWAGAGDPDPLAESVDSAVREIEILCRPNLMGGRYGSGWWRRSRKTTAATPGRTTPTPTPGRPGP